MHTLRRPIIAIALLLVGSQLTQAVQVTEKPHKDGGKPETTPISQNRGLIKAIEYLASKPQRRYGLDRFEMHSWKRDKEQGWGYEFIFLPKTPDKSTTVLVNRDGTIYRSMGGF